MQRPRPSLSESQTAISAPHLHRLVCSKMPVLVSAVHGLHSLRHFKFVMVNYNETRYAASGCRGLLARPRPRSTRSAFPGTYLQFDSLRHGASEEAGACPAGDSDGGSDDGGPPGAATSGALRSGPVEAVQLEPVVVQDSPSRSLWGGTATCALSDVEAPTPDMMR